MEEGILRSILASGLGQSDADHTWKAVFLKTGPFVHHYFNFPPRGFLFTLSLLLVKFSVKPQATASPTWTLGSHVRPLGTSVRLSGTSRPIDLASLNCVKSAPSGDRGQGLILRIIRPFIKQGNFHCFLFCPHSVLKGSASGGLS